MKNAIVENVCKLIKTVRLFRALYAVCQQLSDKEVYRFRTIRVGHIFGIVGKVQVVLIQHKQFAQLIVLYPFIVLLVQFREVIYPDAYLVFAAAALYVVYQGRYDALRYTSRSGGLINSVMLSNMLS
jgi:hypothetical protein